MEEVQYLETLDIRKIGITKLPRIVYQVENRRNIVGGNEKTYGIEERGLALEILHQQTKVHQHNLKP